MTIRPELLDELLQNYSKPVETASRLSRTKTAKPSVLTSMQLYNAATEDEAELNLELLCEHWDAQYPSIGKSWRNHWANVIPMFSFPPEIRKVMYTTNAIESVNMCLRKLVKNHRIFSNDEAAFKVVYLVIHSLTNKWTMPI